MLMKSTMTAANTEHAVMIACAHDAPWFPVAQPLQGRSDGRRVAGFDELRVAVAAQLPRVLVLDQCLLADDMPRRLATLNDAAPETSILLMIECEARSVDPALMHYGVRGFCRSDVAPEVLVRAVESLLHGAIWLPRDLMPTLVGQLRVEVERAGPSPDAARLARFHSLTQRQMDVVRLVSGGANNKEIARAMGISERTVKAHLSAVFDKLGVSGRLNLALFFSSLKRRTE